MNKNLTIPYKEWFLKRSDAIRCSLANGYALDEHDYQFISNRLMSRFCREKYKRTDEHLKLNNVNEIVEAIKYIFNNGEGETYYNYTQLKKTITSLLNKHFKFNVAYSWYRDGYLSLKDDYGRDLDERLANFDKYLIGYDFECKNIAARDYIILEAKKLKEKDLEYHKKQEELKKKQEEIKKKNSKLNLIKRSIFRFFKKHEQEETKVYDNIVFIEVNKGV